MRSVVVVGVAVQIFAGNVCAAERQAQGAPGGTPTSNTPAVSRTEVQKNFLVVEPSTWDWFGVAFKKDGQKVGPGFFSVVPGAAVKGSAEAERHAARARVFHGFTFGFGIVGFGSLFAGLAVRGDNHRWNDTSTGLVAGGVIAIFTESIFALARSTEMLEAINAYNHDLVEGRLTNDRP